MDSPTASGDALAVRVAAAQQELLILSRTLDSPILDASLRDRVRPAFEVLLKKHLGALKPLAGARRDGGSTLQDWLTLKQARLAREAMYEEYLAFLGGVLVRSAGLDDGICDMADALLRQLARRADKPWGRLTVVSDATLLTTAADIIRLRFPELSVWGLPIAAHEFGHFMATEFVARSGEQRSFPFTDLVVDTARATGIGESLVHELFADVYATVAAGPCVPAAFITLRFDAVGVYTPGTTHPAPAKRVHVMLRSLERVEASADGVWTFGSVPSALRTWWTRGIAAAGEKAPAQGLSSSIATLDDFVDKACGLIDEELPSPTSYGRTEGPGDVAGRWDAARYVATWLRGHSPIDTKDLPADSMPSMLDLVNAAWLCRLLPAPKDPSIDEIHRRALALGRQVAARDRAEVA